MKNYETIHQWTSALNVEKALHEMQALKKKYQWLPCPETLKLLNKLYGDLPKIVAIIRHQEHQNAIHRKFVDVSKLADEAIVKAVMVKFNL